MPSPECSKLGIPDHLHQDDRVPDQSFEEGELLYRRFRVLGKVEDWKNDKSLSVAIFEIKNDSFNRSKYSNPEDVLYNDNFEADGKHHTSNGILSLPVAELNEFDFPVLQNKILKHYTIKVSHTPLVCNYSHSEIFVLEEEQQIDSNKPKSMKAALRDFLLERVTIIKECN